MWFYIKNTAEGCFTSWGAFSEQSYTALLLLMQSGRTVASHMDGIPFAFWLKQEKIDSKVELRIFMNPIGMMYVSPK